MPGFNNDFEPYEVIITEPPGARRQPTVAMPRSVQLFSIMLLSACMPLAVMYLFQFTTQCTGSSCALSIYLSSLVIMILIIGLTLIAGNFLQNTQATPPARPVVLSVRRDDYFVPPQREQFHEDLFRTFWEQRVPRQQRRRAYS